MMFVRIRTQYPDEEVWLHPLDEHQSVILSVRKGEGSVADRGAFLSESQARQLAFCLLTAAEKLSEARDAEHRADDGTPEQVPEPERHLDLV